jgi:hypothetical protein
MYRNFARLPAVYRTFPGVFFIGKSRLDAVPKKLLLSASVKRVCGGEMASRPTAFKVTPGRVKPLLIATISTVVGVAYFNATRTSLNGIDFWLVVAVCTIVAIAGVVIAVLQLPLLEVDGEALSIRNGAFRAPVRVLLRDIHGFVLEPSGTFGTLRVILNVEAEPSHRLLGALNSKDFGFHYTVPLFWVEVNNDRMLDQLHALIEDFKSNTTPR